MVQARIPAVFYRGGTSKAVFFKGGDLPADQAICDRIFLHVIGSPDPYGRQLDGLGGGISSLSKVVIVEPSARDDADVDYTFVQIAVDEPVADYGSMCGNMSAAVGPFAVDEGLVPAAGTEATVRVYNTNTDKLYRATFPMRDGRAVEDGDFEIPGVSGCGARVRLDYLSPGGAVTGRLLPSGRPVDRLEVPGLGGLDVSLVDASNPVAFFRARDLGRSALEAPAALDGDADLMAMLDRIRRAAGVAMGIAETPGHRAALHPKVALVAEPGSYSALDGRRYGPSDYDIAVRIVSMGNIHRAVTLTGAMCLAAAAKIPGTIPNDLAPSIDTLRVGNPSGVLPVSADVAGGADGAFVARSATTYRTQRRIMEGAVLVPVDLLEPAA